MYQNQMNPYMGQTMPYSGNYMRQQCLQRVTGIEGAKAYQLPPNSTIALFDESEDLMYIKSTDSAGFPTIRTFSFEECVTDINVGNKNYITREEMEEYVKQLISKTGQNE